MQESSPSERSTHPFRVLFVSTYVPRECGIATYAEDVLHAIEPYGASCEVLAMERPGEHFEYGPRVIGTVLEDRQESYLLAADTINRGWHDMVSLQYEFGIYGGAESELVVQFINAIKKPVVATLHTLPRNPSSVIWGQLHRIGQRADRLVVMNGLALEILQRVYDVEPGKIDVIHHGAPVPPRARDDSIKAELGLAGRQVLSTFGLITPAKGIEFMIQAMPLIVKRHPEAVYYILGQTHPVLVQEEGERYRGMLENLVFDLGMQDNVRFINRYLTKEELVTYLLATDVYITPYVNLEQITSGTLAYALANGCPLVATPYLHAQYLLDDGRGLLVPPRDPNRLAKAVMRILGDPEMMAHMVRANWQYGLQMHWPCVGRQYVNTFLHAIDG